MHRRTASRLVRLITTLFLLCGLCGASAQDAEPGSHAAVVIRFGDGQWLVRVADGPGSPMTGLELLQDAGLALALCGGAVCRIGPEGCDYPDEVCFCQCDASSEGCAYWTYSHWDDGEWRYSGVGAGGYTIGPGSIDGWAWGNGAQPPEIQSGAVFDSLCLAPCLPQAEASQAAIHVEVDFRGDENDNASVLARCRRAGDSWPEEGTSLVRGPSGFGGRVAEEQGPGAYEVQLTYTDPDGVNGSAAWVLTTTLHGLYLPAIHSSEATAASQ